MKEDAIVKRYFGSIRTATKMGYEHMAADFAAWRAILLLEGKGEHQSTEQALIDFVRNEYGRTFFSENTKPKDRSTSKDALKRIHRTKKTHPPVARTEPLMTLNLGKGAKLMETMQAARTIIVLHGKWGFSFQEIAECFGVHPSRITQILVEARNMFPDFKK